MNRSQSKEQRVSIFGTMLSVLLLGSLLAIVSFNDARAVDTPETEIVSPPGKKAAEAEKKAIPEKKRAQKKKKKPVYYNGIFYGSLYFVHPELVSIVVMPEPDEELNLLPNTRRIFYVDKYTRYRVDGRKAGIDEIYPGDKVAVRYFSEDRLAIAEAVYVVFGDYKPRDYRRRWRSPPKEEGDEEKEEKPAKPEGPVEPSRKSLNPKKPLPKPKPKEEAEE